jgi:hypothetical protein
VKGQKYHVGAIVIVPSTFDNPYWFRETGAPRVEKLTQFRRGTLDTDLWTAWYAPGGGGAKRITADDVHWEASGVPE